MKFTHTFSKIVLASLILSIVPVFESNAMRRGRGMRNARQQAHNAARNQARQQARAQHYQPAPQPAPQPQEPTSLMDFFKSGFSDVKNNIVTLAVGAVGLLFAYKLFNTVMADDFAKEAKTQANSFADDLVGDVKTDIRKGFAEQIREAIFGKKKQEAK